MPDFMQPEIYRGSMIIVDSEFFFPASVFSVSDALREAGITDADGEPVDGEWSVRVESGFWGRLSAPGFLDCTDWSGPFETEEEAIAELREAYGEEGEEDEDEE